MTSPASPESAKPARVTLRDIAREAGVHFTTVGVALRDKPQIPLATRRRIQKIARRLGYRPDPMLAALNAYRRGRKAPAYQATLAWINNWPHRQDLYKLTGFQEYFTGAHRRAAELGYLLEEFWLAEPGMTAPRLTNILRARNVAALLLAPQPRAHTSLDLDFRHFSIVSFGYSLQPAVFHVVTNHHFHSMMLTLEHLQLLGYRRIGLFVAADWNEKVENSFFGGLAAARARNPALADLPPLIREGSTDHQLLAWLRSSRPDVVLSSTNAAARLRRLGYQIPAGLGFASLSLSHDDSTVSGIYQNDLRIGAAAVDLVISMIHRGERGLPDVPTRLLIESEWRPGQTLQVHPAPRRRIRQAS